MQNSTTKSSTRILCKKLLRIVLCILLVVVLMFTMDTVLAFSGARPVFCIPFAANDGGSVWYLGLGYQIMQWHSISSTEESMDGYLVGTEVHSWFWDKNNGPSIELTHVPLKTPSNETTEG